MTCSFHLVNAFFKCCRNTSPDTSLWSLDKDLWKTFDMWCSCLHTSWDWFSNIFFHLLVCFYTSTLHAVSHSFCPPPHIWFHSAALCILIVSVLLVNILYITKYAPYLPDSTLSMFDSMLTVIHVGETETLLWETNKEARKIGIREV